MLFDGWQIPYRTRDGFTMDPFFFRVEHDLVRSEAFRQLNGSAVKVYLVIGLYADFETGWAYPSIRTIAKQSGLSRQTVLNAIEDLVDRGMLATSKSPGRSTAYRILHSAPPRPSSKSKKSKNDQSNIFSEQPETVLNSLVQTFGTVLNPGTPPARTGPDSSDAEAQFWASPVPETRPEQEDKNKTQSNDSVPSIDIPETPFRITMDGRLVSLLPLADVLRNQGVSEDTAKFMVLRYEADQIVKAVLNVVYLQKQGKLQNGPGYIRMALEKNYELLPVIVQKIKKRHSLLHANVDQTMLKEKKHLERERIAAEEAAISRLIENMNREDLDRLIRKAVSSLPEALVRRNPSISNPLIRARVYELATRITESN